MHSHTRKPEERARASDVFMCMTDLGKAVHMES